jgi:predicted thioesterase
MKTLKVGLTGKKEMIVGEADLASFMGNIGADVLSTPRVVLLAEHAARDAITGCLPQDHITVGTMIRMKHFAATPLGVKVRAEARLRKIEGRKLLFDVSVYDVYEKISEGENERFIVSEKKFLDKVKAKVEMMQNP